MRKMILFGVLFFLAFAVEGLATDITNCAVLNTTNTVYNLIANVINTTTSCMFITAANVTLDCLGHSIDRGVPAAGSYGIIVMQNSNNVTVKNCSVYNWTNGIYLYNTSNNSIINNYASNNTNNFFINEKVNTTNFTNNTLIYGGMHGFYFMPNCHNNTVANGTIHDNTNDYYVTTTSNNFFTNTNFTSARKISFAAGGWFNYNNDSKSIWLKSGNIIGAATGVVRTLIAWGNNTMQWNDTPNVQATLSYNLTGLYDSSIYSLFINNILNQTITTDANGALNFTLDTMSSLAPTEIKLIANTSITNCSGGGTPYLNFTAYNEDTNVAMNFSQDMTIILRDSSGLQVKNASFQLRNWTNYSICISPTNGIYYANTTIKYWNDTNFSTRYYYLQNATLTNSTTNISLWLLSNASSTQITTIVYDEINNPTMDVIIQALKYDIGTGTYFMVAEGKSDYQGLSYLSLKLHDIYKFMLLQNGIILREYTPMQLEQTTLEFHISAAEIPDYFSYYDKVATACSFDNTSNNLTCSYLDTSGLPSSMSLIVTRLGIAGSSVNCSQSSTSSSGSFVCSLSGNYTFKYSLIGTHYSSSVKYLWQSGFINIGGTGVNFGSVGLFLAVIICMFLPLLARYDIRVAIILEAFGIIFSIFSGLIHLQVDELAIIFSVAIISGIVAWRIKS